MPTGASHDGTAFTECDTNRKRPGICEWQWYIALPESTLNGRFSSAQETRQYRRLSHGKVTRSETQQTVHALASRNENDGCYVSFTRDVLFNLPMSRVCPRRTLNVQTVQPSAYAAGLTVTPSRYPSRGCPTRPASPLSVVDPPATRMS